MQCETKKTIYTRTLSLMNSFYVAHLLAMGPYVWFVELSEKVMFPIKVVVSWR